MTDAQMLQNLLAVYEAMVKLVEVPVEIFELKEVIAELRRRIALDKPKLTPEFGHCSCGQPASNQCDKCRSLSTEARP